MSTFYILPPRPLLGQHVLQFMQTWFPGLRWDSVNRAELAETVGATAGQHPGVYVIFREDLPEGVEIPHALQSDFGAEPGDEVVEVATGTVRRWKLAA